MKIAIASGKGGTGKTTVAVNLFEALRIASPIDVELIDADVEEPNVGIFVEKSFENSEFSILPVNVMIPVIDSDKCTFCGKCVHFCEFNSILMVKEIGHIAVMEDLCKSCGACVYACNDSAITEQKKSLGDVSVYENKQARFIEGRLRIGSPFATPVIKAAKAQRDANRISIVDSPPGTSCTVVESVFDADFVIVVTEPTPFGLHDLKLMVETLNQLHRHFGVVINRFHGEYHLVHEYLEKHQIPLLMEIPYRDEFARWYSQGEIFVAKDAELLKGFTKLFEDVKQIFIQKSMYL